MNPFSWLEEGVARAIMGIHSVLGALFGPDTGWAWGLSIVVLVMFIRLLLVPLFVKQVHAQRKMAEHAPHLQELRKKYKGDKQRLQEETMKFYKENGVNPLAGCLPMIPQMIIFFALFSVLRRVASWKSGNPGYGLTEAAVRSAQKATIFGVHLSDKLILPHSPNLSVGGSIVIVITVALSATTTFMTVRQSAKRGLMQTNVDPDNPMAQSQKIMQYIVPFFSLTGLYWQYGLVLYWVSTNVWTLGQQYIMFRNWTPIEQVVAANTGGTGAAKAGAGTAKASIAKAGAGPAKAGTGTAKAGTGPAKAATGSGKTGTGAARGGAGTAKTGSGVPRTGQAARTGSSDTTRSGAANGSANGSEKRGGLLRLGRSKQEPEPADDVPSVKVVRQQPSRQAKSKRSGKR